MTASVEFHGFSGLPGHPLSYGSGFLSELSGPIDWYLVIRWTSVLVEGLHFHCHCLPSGISQIIMIRHLIVSSWFLEHEPIWGYTEKVLCSIWLAMGSFSEVAWSSLGSCDQTAILPHVVIPIGSVAILPRLWWLPVVLCCLCHNSILFLWMILISIHKGASLRCCPIVWALLLRHVLRCLFWG